MGLPPIRSDLADGAIVLLMPEEREVYSTKGQRLKRPFVGVRMRAINHGTLKCPGGRLEACDPQNLDADAKGFADKIPAGDYAAFTILAESLRGEPRAAFGGVWFQQTLPARYSLALRVGERAEDIDPMASGGVGTDSGVVGIMAVADMMRLEKVFDGDGAPVTDAIEAALGENKGGIVAIPKAGVSIVAWYPGFGDGSYTAYWGHDKSGTIVNMVIDFGVVANGLVAPSVPRETVGDSMEYEPA